METIKQYQFIYGAIFLLANKLQLLGDRTQGKVSTKQFFLLVTVKQFRSYTPSLTELAEFMACSRQNVKKLARPLCDQNLIQLLPDEKDQRVQRVSLTETGDTYLEERMLHELPFYEQIFMNVSDVQLSYLETGLLKLAENVAKMEFSKSEVKQKQPV